MRDEKPHHQQCEFADVVDVVSAAAAAAVSAVVSFHCLVFRWFAICWMGKSELQLAHSI